MAITKIIGSIHAPSKGGKYQVLKNTIDYILNPVKTEQGKYTGAINCLVDNALSEMKRNFKYWHKEPKNQRDRIGYHFTISWKAGCEISAETALKITEEFCRELLNDYPLIYAVHTDKDHIHSHICFSSVSCIDGKKYRYNDNDWEKILQPVTDRLCQKYGFPTLEMDREALGEEIEAAEETKQRNSRRAYTRKGYVTREGDSIQTEEEKKQKRRSNTKYYKEETEAYSKQDHIRVDIDDGIYRSRSWSDFVTIMRSKGYQMKFGKYFSVKAPGMERYRRTYRLGEEYSEKAIRDRIAIHDQPLPDLYHPEEEAAWSEKDVKYKGRIRLTEESRKHYAMQYRQGLLKPGQNRSYYVIRSAIYWMRKTEEREKFLAGHRIYDTQSARSDKEWDGPHKLSDMLEIPAVLLPYFNDYKIFVLSARDIDPNLFENKDNQDFFQMIQEFYSSEGRIQKKKFMEKYAGKNIWWETLAALGAVTGYKGLLKKAVENKGGNVTMCNALLDWEMEITEEVTKNITNKDIKTMIKVLRKAGVEDSFIAESLKEEYLLSEEKVKEYL